MKKATKRVLIAIAALVLLVVPVAAIAAGGTFTDDDTSIFEGDIEWMSANGVTSGCGAGIYCPNDNVTRGQMAAFMKRLATKKVVDAATAVTAQNATTAANADKLDGKDSTAFMKYGTIVTTVGGAAWLPFYPEPSSVTRFTSSTSVSGDGKMVLALDAPASFDGVEYGLASVEICVGVASGAYLTDIWISREDTAITSSWVLSDNTDRTTDGCYVYPVGRSLGKGAGILLTLAGGGTAWIGGTTLTWTTAAFVP